MSSYLNNKEKKDCVACGACAQACPHSAIEIKMDEYGFYYPQINHERCLNCGICTNVCIFESPIKKNEDNLYSFGGYINDSEIRKKSTSGGAFTAICRAFCDKQDQYAIFGCTSRGLNIFHTCVNNIEQVSIFNSSKYGQSIIGDSFAQTKSMLLKNKMVVFSGTPCQIAALYKFLGKTDISNLLTIEVLCTGIPSALFMKKFDEWCIKKYGCRIKSFNYRYTNKNKWDDQTTLLELQNGKKVVTARWFSNFYSIFLQRLMSRPSCNKCQFVTKERVADITLSDLWGLDKEYPDLYDNGSGSSWVICNTAKGVKAFDKAKPLMKGHEVEFEKMKKYQRPGLIQKTVHHDYDKFMEDIKVLDYEELCKKWAKKPSPKIIFQKYIYNNRMRVRIWKIKQRCSITFKR